MWRQRGHFYMVFNVYDRKVTRGKGGAHVALYEISFDSEVRRSVKCEFLKRRSKVTCLKINDNNRKVLFNTPHMPNMIALSITVKQLWAMLQ